MSQRCGRRTADERCTYRAAHRVVESTTDEAPVGVGLCLGCGGSLERRGLADLIDLGAAPSVGAQTEGTEHG